jgi:hypothetical protein
MDNNLSTYALAILVHMQTSYYLSLSAMCREKISCLDPNTQMYWHMQKHLQSYLFKYFRVVHIFLLNYFTDSLVTKSNPPSARYILYTPLLHLNPWPVKITCNQPRGMSTLPCKAMTHSHKYIICPILNKSKYIFQLSHRLHRT